MLHVVNAETVAAQPWRNGGGVTRELLAWPSSAGWTVRVSVADITRDGPFSAYEGVDRAFAVLRGEGVRLGDFERMCTVASGVFAFDGALAPACALIDGPTRDLNLMVRRPDARGTMLRARDAERDPWWREEDPSGAVLRAVFTRDGCAVDAAEGAVELGPMSLAWSDDAGAARPWRVRERTEAGVTFAIVCRVVGRVNGVDLQAR